jgi:hypothetical protein
VTALLVAACGSSGKSKSRLPADVQAASTVVQRWLSAVAAGNGAAACRLMTRSYQARLVSGSPSTCPSALSTVAYNLTASEKAMLSKAKIAKAKVSGGKARVHVKGEKGAAVLIKHSGHWLIAGGASA